ncbi:hypothetical protein [Mycoplasma parvum]|nr:hypothetical protein [Mycoplasma parvum]
MTENSTTNRMPNIIGEEDQMEEIDDICDSIDTLWSSDKQLLNEKEGLLIRGHQDKVKELIKFNWDDLLKSPNYRNQNIQNSDFILDEFNFLSLQNCQVKKEKNNDWIEIKCLLT